MYKVESIGSTDYMVSLKAPYQVGYAAAIDELFVYWLEDDIVHCLGYHGKYQVAFIEELDTENFVPLGDL